ncbi:Long-chain-alcohol oxidase FAO1 [Chlorella sorokiniana]|uniref:long-chain-alcohol oxidase n=1 Tax=Chlorella sorokiniana TaxID=3076 RepID=A0A2P6TM14_CHLSO|nr:Long-chain-alcohol oxidase FAO1 [Chlorella sorokiniana]|eukprot:PRW45373.1 Long-chain-alcohol oxidase FAO1 [Chlorella sorokiniana]
MRPGSVAALRAVAEALLPPCDGRAAAAGDAGEPAAAALWAHTGGGDEVVYKVIETIEKRVPPESRRELHLLLRLLGSRWGSLLLLGRASVGSGRWLPDSFADLPLPQREAVLLGWATGSDMRMRKAFKGLKSLIMSTQFTYLTPEGNSDLLAALRYPVIDPERPPSPAPAALAAEAAVAAAVVDLSDRDSSPGSAAGAGAALAAAGLRVAWPSDFQSGAVSREKCQLAVECDVVIIGSGAGGGPAAANLARAGLRVVVLEKAGFVTASAMTLREGEAFQSMYENGAIMTSEDGTMAVLAGSTLGGGTRINWCASFKTPPHVRREWEEQHGLPQFASPEYDAALDAVCSRVGVRLGFKHSDMCSTLRSGLQNLGVHAAEVPRNCLNPDCSGHCGHGCARGYKQDSVNTWLADACQAGARIITGAWVERILLQPNSEAPPAGGHPRRKRAAGVLVLAGSEASPLRLAVQAPVVISAAGSIHSPALLLRSGISCGGNVGSNLRLHPCTVVVGVFPEEQGEGAPAFADVEDLGQRAQQAQQQQGAPPRRLHMNGAGGSSASASGGSIRPWEGALMSIFSNRVGDWEGSGYGCLLYTPAVHPGLFAAASPWLGGEDFKDLMLQYPNACVVLVLTRDSGSGRVVIDSAGRPRIHYSLSKFDEGSMVKGMELGLRCMAAAGSHTVMTCLNSPTGRFKFDQPGIGAVAAAPDRMGTVGTGAAASFEAYLAGVQQTGFAPLQLPLFCAHQMGTCRLGADPKTSVLDPSGECWEVAGLYCADGSCFPTPTGLNPMITIEAISYMLTQQLATKLVAQGKGREHRRRSAGGGAAAAPKL